MAAASANIMPREQKSVNQSDFSLDFENDEKLKKDITEMENTTKNCLRLGYEAREVGDATLTALREQGEQLDKINERTYDIHDNIYASERALSGIESCWGGLFNRYDVNLPSIQNLIFL